MYLMLVQKSPILYISRQASLDLIAVVSGKQIFKNTHKQANIQCLLAQREV